MVDNNFKGKHVHGVHLIQRQQQGQKCSHKITCFDEDTHCKNS